MFSPRLVRWVNRIPSPRKETYLLRFFGLTRVPILGFLWPSVVEIKNWTSTIRIPISYRSRNHVNSMYFGALCAGADMAAGSLATKHILEMDEEKVSKLEKPINFLFKDVQGKFLKRAESDIDFVCNDGIEIRQSILWRLETGERQNIPVQVSAKDSNTQKSVASFDMTLSLK